MTGTAGRGAAAKEPSAIIDGLLGPNVPLRTEDLGCHGGRTPARFVVVLSFPLVCCPTRPQHTAGPSTTENSEVRTTARGSLAIAALAFQATILPLPALAQTDYVPSAAAPGPTSGPTSGPLISRHISCPRRPSLAGALLGDRQFREESQEHRDATSNSVASVGNTFGDYKMLIPVLSAGYLAGQIAGSREIKGTVLRAGAAVALATGITTGLKYSFGRSRPDVGAPTSSSGRSAAPPRSRRVTPPQPSPWPRPSPTRPTTAGPTTCSMVPPRSPRSPGSTTIVTGRPMS